MTQMVTVPKEKYEFLIKCEKIVREIEEDHSLTEEEIKLIEQAKKSKLLSKDEFLTKTRAL